MAKPNICSPRLLPLAALPLCGVAVAVPREEAAKVEVVVALPAEEESTKIEVAERAVVVGNLVVAVENEERDPGMRQQPSEQQ